jgi:hypothetical protein
MATEDNNQQTPSGQDQQNKFTISGGLNKSSDRLGLDKKEYIHLKNGFPSSENSDELFIQNAPSNKFCLNLPEGFIVINKPVFVKERKLNILCILNPSTKESEIGFFHFETCIYEKIINAEGLNFNINYPIKGTYKIIDCNLTFYFQDGFNPDRRINLDKLPYKKEIDETGCVITSFPLELEIGQINIQNDLLPPIVKISSVEETGALYSGAYQFAVAYSNSVGNELSSYYSKTNIVPIYKDSINLGWTGVEGSDSNVLTSKSIILSFENLDTRYDYINIAVIKTIQGSPAYEMVATIPTGSKSYTYTGRETTKFLTTDQLMGLYPDYINSKTLTSGNNYLIRANLSTQDEGNYQRLANLIELGWAVTKIKADDISQSYKNPLTTTNKTSAQRGEVYPYGLKPLFTNGKKGAVYHIPGRQANPEDLIMVTDPSCNTFELTPSGNTCVENEVSGLPYWQLYDTASVDYISPEDNDCTQNVYASGEFAYWESSDKYPCDKEVWGDLAGEPIRHHKFPSNETFHIHNQPYERPGVGTSNMSMYNADNVYLYPIGVALKHSLDYYITIALNQGLISQEEADLIAGFELVRGDRTGEKSVIAKGLMYNTNSYTDQTPGGDAFAVGFPNYPFNDLSPDVYLNNSLGDSAEFAPVIVEVTGVAYTQGDLVEFPGDGNPIYDDWQNPYPSIDFPVPITFTPSFPFQVKYSSKLRPSMLSSYTVNQMVITLYDASGNVTEEYDVEVTGSSSAGVLNNFRKDLFTFHSPDTSFKKPFLGTYLRNHVIAYGACKQRFEPVEGHPFIKTAASSDAMNHAVSCKSEGVYNNFIAVEPQDRRRQITESGYLSGNTLTTLPSSGLIFNNLSRESSVILDLNCSIQNPVEVSPFIRDTSRNTISSVGKCSCKTPIDDRIRDAKTSYSLDPYCTTAYRRISSYYSSINIKIPNQYGQINTIKYLGTGKYLSRTNSIQDDTIVFGGDTFITKFSLKRKTGFFDVDFINQSAFGVDYRNNFLGASVNYYLRNTGGIGKYVIDSGSSNLDCTNSTNTFFTTLSDRNGWVYLYNIGIANFYVESDVNTELRYSGENIWEKWYPSLKQTNLYKWTEQIYNPIIEDNYYLYNWNYSKQNTEEALFTPAPDYAPNTKCKNTHPRRIIYSKQANEEESSDSWQVYPANQYYDVDSYLGDIIDVQALDTQQILVRCENGSAIFNAYDTLELDKTIVTVGSGGMFSQRPQTFGNTDNGYGGSSSKYAIDITSLGVFYTDIERGQIFLYQKGLMPISDQKMTKWFIRNLYSKFLRTISNLDNFEKLNQDNPFYGFGLQSVYDSKNKLWFLTKKDYLLRNREELINFSITDLGELLYKGGIVDFSNKELFKDVSWTISYNPAIQKWFSFHSFYPNFTMYSDEDFYTGINKVLDDEITSVIYKHWDKKSFQSYYEELFPFEITLTTSKPGIVNILHSLEYELKNYEVINEETQDLFFTHLFNFNKAIISTDNQSSGLLLLNPKDKNNPYQTLDYPRINDIDPLNLKIDTLYSKVEGNKYRLNQFFDIVKDKNNNLPIFEHDENGVDRYPVNLEYDKVNNEVLRSQKLRNSWFDVTLIQDESDKYKMVLNLLFNKTLKSIK